MKLKTIASGITALLFLALSISAHAGTLTFETTGTLGPVLEGTDPLGLSGDTFSLTGTITQNTVPISVTSDSATYDVASTLAIMIGKLPLSGFYATITLTDPATGPDLVSFDFNVVEYTFTPIVSATLSLPAGTLHGTKLQDFSAGVTQPDSYFDFTLLGTSQEIPGSLGVTGTTYMGSGPPKSGVPEPATITLLAAGLLLLALVKRQFVHRGAISLQNFARRP